MNIVNAILFQATWFACVLGGTLWGLFGLSTLLLFMAYAGNWRQDLTLLSGAALIGAAVDTLWIQLGILDFGTLLAPVWIIFMWMGLALTVNYSLSFLKNKPMLAAIMAACSAPLSYFAGERFGAVDISNPQGIVLISIAWGTLFYVTFKQQKLPYAQS
ncbi:MAG: DUF2878 domain-containing protein [Pseudomonadota bacterium]